MSPEISNPNTDLELLKLIEEEHVRIEAEVLLERNWWTDRIILNPKIATENGTLIDVPSSGRYYCLISKLRNKEEPRVLRPGARSFLDSLTNEWGETIESQHIGIQSARLAVISLFRTPEQQAQLRIATHRATSGDSSHSAGAAIDFDPNSYYLGEDKTAIKRSSIEFDSRYVAVFIDVLQRLETKGQCHVIYELNFVKLEENTIRIYEACYHVCVSPNFKP